jgi:hypothetical protein
VTGAKTLLTYGQYLQRIALLRAIDVVLEKIFALAALVPSSPYEYYSDSRELGSVSSKTLCSLVALIRLLCESW